MLLLLEEIEEALADFGCSYGKKVGSGPAIAEATAGRRALR